MATKTKKTVYRSSVNGRFVTSKSATKHPRTTERQRVALVLPSHKKPTKSARTRR